MPEIAVMMPIGLVRISVAAILCVLLASEASAQQYVWNPNSPRGQRETRIFGAPSAAAAPAATAIEPERWGTLSVPMGQSTWGTIGTAGWSGAAGSYLGQSTGR